MPDVVEAARCIRGLEIQLHAFGPAGAGNPGELRSRIYRSTGAARDEDVGCGKGRLDFVHAVWHLAEPDNIRPQAGSAAAPAAAAGLPFRRVAPTVPAAATAGGPDFPVNVEYLPGAGELMQVIDILCHKNEFPAPFPLQAGERVMGRVRLGVPVGGKPLAVEFQHPNGVTRKRLRRRDILDPHPAPEPVRVSEGAQAGLRRDSRPGQYYDPAPHSPRLRIPPNPRAHTILCRAMPKRLHRLRAAFAPAPPGMVPTATSLQVLSRLLADNGRRYAGRYALAVLFMLVASSCTALSAWVMEDVINGIFVERDQNLLLMISAGIAAIFLVKGFSSYAHTTILARTGNSIVAELQRQVYDSILMQSLPFFSERRPGDLVNRMVRTAGGARSALDMVFVVIGRDVMTLVGLLVVMITKDAVMTAIAMVMAPVVVILVARLSKRIRKLAGQAFLSHTEVVATIQETASGVDMIKAFTLEERMRMRADDAIVKVQDRNDRIARLQARTSPIMESLGGLSFAAVILYGGNSVINGAQNPGAFFAFLTALLLAYEPAKKLSRARLQIEAQLVNARLLYEIIDKEPDFKDPPGAPALSVSRGQVEFENVRFTYRGASAPAIDGLTFLTEPGTVTALVGHSGAGKSSTFSLIERFYLADSGRVMIDGQDVSQVTVKSLRENVAIVSQNTFLFDGTVRENLLFGKADATDAEIVAAATAAHAHDFICALPYEYDSPIGENGYSLSGGQRQRLSITRALLRGAPILLLDEPTASLDAESEAHIQAALDALLRGRTAIVIAHRLSTVRNADTILVMDKGRIVQSGTHNGLISEGGIYSRLYELQFRDPDPDCESPPEEPEAARQ